MTFVTPGGPFRFSSASGPGARSSRPSRSKDRGPKELAHYWLAVREPRIMPGKTTGGTVASADLRFVEPLSVLVHQPVAADGEGQCDCEPGERDDDKAGEVAAE